MKRGRLDMPENPSALGLGIWLFGKVNRQLTARQVRFPALFATDAVTLLYVLIALAVYLL